MAGRQSKRVQDRTPATGARYSSKIIKAGALLAPLWELVRKTLKPELPGSPAKDCAPHWQARSREPDVMDYEDEQRSG